MKEKRTLLSRLGKILLTGTLALYFLLVAFNNIIDYDSNFKFVQHVLSMDAPRRLLDDHPMGTHDRLHLWTRRETPVFRASLQTGI